ncbi:hypothetical protein [Jiangella alba]|uniref:Uncharacterized protein n=1 Tax=Jiangella alba TaxID=561176 RepID=A0A1H5PKV9_9ACTN|nr:hypothetical protein [Jiangella alba]SEF14386.1 hypothetical protein SAMN04488561_4624 [Jiangella alba]
MNGDPVLFGVLPHDLTATAYLFRCPSCGRHLAPEPETPCKGCTKPSRRPARTSTRRRTKATS